MPLWGKTDEAASVPKYLSTADKANAYFVDVEEAGVAANQAKGLDTGGWNLYTTYTDAHGNTRHRAENLVAMRVTNAEAGDNDVLPPAPVITIGTQPAATTVADGATATFTVAATVTQGATATYQWQKSDDAGANWADISGATSASYTTGVLTNADDDQDEYRVVVSVTGGADVTSDAAVLTVTA
jgi:hypothetical protein